MKKAGFLITGLFILLASLTIQAQDNTSDFFLGKWKVVVEGTPSGDTEMFVNIENIDGKLTGKISAEGMDPVEAKSVIQKDNSISISWFTMGYDVSINMKKTDENKVEGDMMGMFNAKIERAE